MAAMSQGIGSLLLNGGMSAASALNPAFAIAGAAAPLFQGILGLTQGARARQISKRNPRQEFAIPGAATNALNDQRNLAMGQAPGISNAMNQLAQSQAASIAAMQNSGGGAGERLAAMALLDRNAGASALDLGAMQEDWKARQMANLVNQQNDYAKWQAQKWDYDVNQPYQEAQAKAAAMNDAANSNIHNALEVAGGLVGQTLTGASPAGQASGAASRQGAGSGIAGKGASMALDTAMKKSADPSKIEPITTRTPSVMQEPSYNYAADGTTTPFVGPRNRINFNPDIGAGDTPDFTDAQAELDSRLRPITSRKSAGSLMPELGTRGRRKPYRGTVEFPELDTMGYRRVK